MKDVQNDFNEARQKLATAQGAMKKATQELEAIRTAVKAHFLQLAEQFNYTFGFDGSIIDDPMERYEEDAGFRYERKGHGTVFVNLRHGTITITDTDGRLLGALKNMGIANRSKFDDMIELDINTAYERLGEALEKSGTRRSTRHPRSPANLRSEKQTDGRER